MSTKLLKDSASAAALQAKANEIAARAKEQQLKAAAREAAKVVDTEKQGRPIRKMTAAQAVCISNQLGIR